MAVAGAWRSDLVLVGEVPATLEPGQSSMLAARRHGAAAAVAAQQAGR